MDRCTSFAQGGGESLWVNQDNDPPDLGARNEIVVDNIRATQVLYTVRC